jgi:transposase-like protein
MEGIPMGLFFHRRDKNQEEPVEEGKTKSGLREDHTLYYAKDNPHPICKYCYDTKHEENELEGPDFIGLYTCPSCGRQYQRRAD